jgi:hypothetical protein
MHKIRSLELSLHSIILKKLRESLDWIQLAHEGGELSACCERAGQL